MHKKSDSGCVNSVENCESEIAAPVKIHINNSNLDIAISDMK